MATLPQLTRDFNRQIKLSNNGGSLSSDTGEIIFREFDEKIGFFRILTDFLNLKDHRLYHTHSNENLLRQKLFQTIAGYAEDDAADQLMNVSIFTQIIGTDALASQPRLYHFYARFDEESIQQLHQVNQEFSNNLHAFRGSKAVIFDLDSTHAGTYGD